MVRRPLFLLIVGLSCIAGSVGLRSGHNHDAWADLVGFALGMLGGVSLLIGFYSAAFLAGGQKVVWPLAIYFVTIVSTVATLLLWFNLNRPEKENGRFRHRETGRLEGGKDAAIQRRPPPSSSE